MYGTVKTDAVPTVTDYASALAYHSSIRPLRGHSSDSPRPIGRRSRRNVKTVRMLPDGSVAFRLYYTDVVTYRPDGAIVVEGYRSVSTGAFARHVLPEDLWLYSTSSVLALIPRKAGQWPSFWVFDPVAKRHRRRTDIRVVSCGTGEKVTLRRAADTWVPDMDTLVPFRWRELDRPAARRVAVEQRLDEFNAWLAAYTALGGKTQGAVRSVHIATIKGALECVRDGHFVEAADLLPAYERSYWCRQRSRWVVERVDVSPSAVASMRRHAFVEAGATIEREAKILDWGTWANRVRRNRY